MSKGLNRSRARGKPLLSSVVKLTIPVTALALSTGSSGATGDGWATAVLRGLPEGNLLILGAVASLQFTSADAGLTTTWTGAYAIGTSATADATLSGTDANVVQSTTLSAATAKVSPLTRGTSSAATTPLDNTDKSLNLNLNVKVDDATISANGVAMTVTGQVYVAVLVLGDD